MPNAGRHRISDLKRKKKEEKPLAEKGDNRIEIDEVLMEIKDLDSTWDDLLTATDPKEILCHLEGLISEGEDLADRLGDILKRKEIFDVKHKIKTAEETIQMETIRLADLRSRLAELENKCG